MLLLQRLLLLRRLLVQRLLLLRRLRLLRWWLLLQRGGLASRSVPLFVVSVHESPVASSTTANTRFTFLLFGELPPGSVLVVLLVRSFLGGMTLPLALRATTIAPIPFHLVRGKGGLHHMAVIVPDSVLRDRVDGPLGIRVND